ncbi:uncharacterized protein LOC132202968 [Neocloeon triangulifer]|uniref:uncharacterized protein LOC132202968 n=1 Tax=Neocloeon triangulifer TaxID=2078957 RepID=UPI00286EC0A5|nr:uncharacterized protein LOC132202968 [Neocloeon triangulifer]
MTRYMNAMPQPSAAPTSGPRPDCGGDLCQQRARLQVAMPNQLVNCDELNTPVIESENIFENMQDGVCNTPGEDFGFGSGISFVSNNGMDSQELLQTLMNSQEPLAGEDLVMPSAISSSQESSSFSLHLEIKSEPTVDTTTTPCAAMDTPDILNEFNLTGRFSLVDFITNDEVTSEVTFEPLDSTVQPYASQGTSTAKFTELKPMPSPPSPVLLVNVPSPDSTSPASVHSATFSGPQHVLLDGSASHSSDYEASDSDISFQNMKRPAASIMSGPSTSKRSRAMDDDMSSIPSSANELKILEHRQRNNAASRKSRQNKKSKDEEYQQVLYDLEMRNQRLSAKVRSLENIRDRLRVAALAKCRGK